jgi:hypothetical protein
MNGTTNFMLSAMESRGVDYADILAEAQRLGYAEGRRGGGNREPYTGPLMMVPCVWLTWGPSGTQR